MSNSILACTRLSVSSAWLWKNAKHCTTESKTITANAVFCELENIVATIFSQQNLKVAIIPSDSLKIDLIIEQVYWKH